MAQAWSVLQVAAMYLAGCASEAEESLIVLHMDCQWAQVRWFCQMKDTVLLSADLHRTSLLTSDHSRSHSRPEWPGSAAHILPLSQHYDRGGTAGRAFGKLYAHRRRRQWSANPDPDNLEVRSSQRISTEKAVMFASRHTVVLQVWLDHDCRLRPQLVKTCSSCADVQMLA